MIALQWIYDLPLYLEGLIKEYEDALKEDKSELENLEIYMKELLAPIRGSAMPDWIKNNEKLSSVERAVSEKVTVLFEKTLGKSFK